MAQEDIKKKERKEYKRKWWETRRKNETPSETTLRLKKKADRARAKRASESIADGIARREEQARKQRDRRKKARKEKRWKEILRRRGERKTCEENMDQKSDVDTEKNTKKKCLGCCEEEVQTYFIPCGHNGFCTKCSIRCFKETNKCPFCKQIVKDVMNWFTGERTKINDGNYMDFDECIACGGQGYLINCSFCDVLIHQACARVWDSALICPMCTNEDENFSEEDYLPP